MDAGDMLDQIFLTPQVDARSVFDVLEALGFRARAYTNNDPDPPERIELADNPVLNLARMGDRATTAVWYWFDFHAPDRRTQLRLQSNGRLGVSSLELVGPEAAGLRRMLEARLPHDDRSLLYDRAARATELEHRVRALFLLALGKAPIPEPHVLRLVRDALADDCRVLRANAIYATAYFEWPAVVPMLRELSARESDADLIWRAELVADDIDSIRPDRMGSGRYWRIHAELEGRSEELWIRRFASFSRDEETSWLVSSIPHTLEGISLDDVIQIEHRAGDVVMMSSIETKSGHRTLCIEAEADRIEPLALGHNVRFEQQVVGRVAMDVPPGVDLEAIARELDALAVPWKRTD